MPHHPELLEDVSEGVESREGNCGDKEDDGVDLSGFWGWEMRMMQWEGGRYAWITSMAEGGTSCERGFDRFVSLPVVHSIGYKLVTEATDHAY